MKEVEVVSAVSPVQFRGALQALVNDNWEISQTCVTADPDHSGALYTAIMIRDGYPEHGQARTSHFTQEFVDEAKKVFD